MNIDPTTTEGRAELRQLLADGRNDEWLLCEDGRTVAEDASEDEAKWIADAGPCTADLIVAAVNALPALLDELEKTQRGARTLGEIIHRTGLEVLDATGAHHLINDDGDGDWQLVSELLAELRPARDAAIARAEEAEAAIDRVREAACFHLGGDAENVILRALDGEDTDIWGEWGE